MTPAEVVHKELGIRPLARALHRHPRTVSGWKITGLVPAKYHLKILKLADGRITPEELVLGRQHEKVR